MTQGLMATTIAASSDSGGVAPFLLLFVILGGIALVASLVSGGNGRRSGERSRRWAGSGHYSSSTWAADGTGSGGDAGTSFGTGSGGDTGSSFSTGSDCDSGSSFGGGGGDSGGSSGSC